MLRPSATFLIPMSIGASRNAGAFGPQGIAGLTEAVCIVVYVTKDVQVSTGDVYDLGYHVGWCPRYRHCEELIYGEPG